MAESWEQKDLLIESDSWHIWKKKQDPPRMLQLLL